jgi:hypothetical protein
MIIIGIDPGKNTGVAMARNGRLEECTSMAIHDAMEYVINWRNQPAGHELLVRFEDARQRKWFGDKGGEAKQGAGSIKRDCTIWQDFLIAKCIAYDAVAPKAGATKWPANWLATAYGWTSRTNEHGRDAAVLAMVIMRNA